MATAASPYLRHRFPPEIIAHCVLLSIRFPLSFRAVEEMMLMRGVQVSYETIRRWRQKFGQQFANQLRRRRPRTGDKWYLDEVFLKINGQTRIASPKKTLWESRCLTDNVTRRSATDVERREEMGEVHDELPGQARARSHGRRPLSGGEFLAENTHPR